MLVALALLAVLLAGLHAYGAAIVLALGSESGAWLYGGTSVAYLLAAFSLFRRRLSGPLLGILTTASVATGNAILSGTIGDGALVFVQATVAAAFALGIPLSNLRNAPLAGRAYAGSVREPT
jgi:hypothetical protein